MAIMRVAREKRMNMKFKGGTSRKAILLKTKLPPQNSVATTSQMVAVLWLKVECEVSVPMGDYESTKGEPGQQINGGIPAITVFR
jgi:hypothetical protein